MTKKQKKTINFALWYLASNSDDENVHDHLEESTESCDAKDHCDYLQTLIDKFGG